MTWGWLMNILIIAHIFSSLLLSPLSMPSLSISNAVSPGFLSSESRIKRRRSLQFSIENSSKDVRWNTDEPITQEIQASSMLRENSVQRWSVKYWTFFAAVQWRRWFLSRHCWCWKVDKIVLKTMFLFFAQRCDYKEILKMGRMLCSIIVNYIPENGLKKF